MRKETEMTKPIREWEILPQYFCWGCGINVRVSPEDGKTWGCPECEVVTNDLIVFGRIGESRPTRQTADQAAFERELAEVINRHSVENESDTPDFILASFLRTCLGAYGRTVKRLLEWNDSKPDVRIAETLDASFTAAYVDG